MGQEILLPENILNKIKSPIGAKLRKEMSNDIEHYANEVSLTSIILSDNFMSKIYNHSDGYMAAIDEISKWSAEFVSTYAHVTEWEDFCYNQKEFEGVQCWDSFVISWGERKLNQFINKICRKS